MSFSSMGWTSSSSEETSRTLSEEHIMKKVNKRRRTDNTDEAGSRSLEELQKELEDTRVDARGKEKFRTNNVLYTSKYLCVLTK